MSFLTPEQLQQFSELGLLDDQQAQLQRKMQLAQVSRNQPQPKFTTGLGAALGQIGNLVGGYQAAQQDRGFADQQNALLGKQRAGHALGGQLVGQAKTPADQQELAGALAASGDPQMGRLGQTLLARMDRQPAMDKAAAEQAAMADPATATALRATLKKLMPEADFSATPVATMQHLLPIAEKAYGADRRATMGLGAGLTPESVQALRPEVFAALSEAMGGPEAVMAMNPMQLATAVKTFDNKQTIGARGSRTDFLKQALGIKEKKLALDIGGRNVPGMEMQDGMVFQPKEAAAAKTLRGNVQRATQALDALEKDFTQYGPDRLASLGGIIPSEALSRMEGNRARALEASMQLQGMNPTIGHQALLEAQIRDPGSFKNVNQKAYLAQIRELRKAVAEAEQGFAAGHGVKTLNPLVQPAQPGGEGGSLQRKTLKNGKTYEKRADGWHEVGT